MARPVLPARLAVERLDLLPPSPLCRDLQAHRTLSYLSSFISTQRRLLIQTSVFLDKDVMAACRETCDLDQLY